ncbi:MAG: CAP domain-containing protein [Clostridium sp.]|jgi:uncharacterized YkwD family protein|uniref:CAP domain-containing protein n=1 Tax=Clostridium sp. TaxID=1506 RepID=UPI0025C5AA05|nr:CAP domain-containing protein [Clostridium sp.]MCH3964432.1 CAP domain-containing protein [Clostridium sp.]MCI1715607.1 CAP domain-containing protein [Clostridium sp.]MCI1799601.1 CAP domain-containing protein [Clostridium sp.]MCI1813791.1 CAP domain-containing protein [Clostridium sp.]MCI1870414.1 CAP domain-containing protein [Clostridium sp.]
MSKRINLIIAALVIAGTLPAFTPNTAKAAGTACPTSVNQQNLLKDILNKYPQLKNCKITNSKNTTTQNSGSNTSTQPKSNANTAGNSGQASSISAEANEVIRLVNVERNKNGLASLKANAELSKVASVKAQDMIDKNYFSHTSPTYGSPFDMMQKFGIKYTAAGENIAYGQKTPAEVMNGWMNSSGHRANILNSNFTEIGVGVAKDKNGTPYWVQMFINPGK